MLWKYLVAEWNASTAVTASLPKTITPIDGLYQRSALELSEIPLILAQDAGSLIKPIKGNHLVPAVGRFDHQGMTFFRVYLSNDPGTFIHLAVTQADPKNILECRIYQPYSELIVPYASYDAAQQAGSYNPQTGEGGETCWEFWLLDNPDPNLGGIIGCPVVSGKVQDGELQYQRTWYQNDARRVPAEVVKEYILKSDGTTGVIDHQMMHYKRALSPTIDEFYLISAATTDGSISSLNIWLGMDISLADLRVFGAG